ncbi:hypothetical protein C8J57DRAFT_1522234 [Mycena rebaudengoi]|nr:hypothetical protein C8J57DRAFT_1522234 [Mycena rebaudengoi]
MSVDPDPESEFSSDDNHMEADDPNEPLSHPTDNDIPPAYYNILNPEMPTPEHEDDDEFQNESEGWSGFDEVLNADAPLSLTEQVNELEEMIGPEDEKELWAMRNDVLTETDRDSIRAFKLKILAKMSREAFEHMRHAFSHKLDIQSEYTIIHRIAVLSRVEPLWIWIDCCVNSCIAYIGDDSRTKTPAASVTNHATLLAGNLADSFVISH